MVHIGRGFEISWPMLRCSCRCMIIPWEYTSGTFTKSIRIKRVSWRQSSSKRPKSRRPQQSALENSPTWLSYTFPSTLFAPCWAWTYRSSDRGTYLCGYFSYWWHFSVSWHTYPSTGMQLINEKFGSVGWHIALHGALFLLDSGFLPFLWPIIITRTSS